ncbi:MAG: carbamoyltransferase [Rubrivivax sp.]|nr:carbamoyltransferase [Rubrivivax sp.]
MSKTILGISAFYHDSAAALVQDGQVVAAAQEERFTRKRHDPRFPNHAINYCLEEAGIEASDVDAVVFYDKAMDTWDRIVRNCMYAGPSSADQFSRAAQSVLGIKAWVQDHVQHAMGGVGKLGRVLFTEHHMAHAASAFYPSPFPEAAILTLDGVGEWSTTSLGHGQGDKVELFEEIDYPHSLGLLYSAFTYYCGFKVNSGEYKLMGLAPYGRPIYADKIKQHLIDLKADGSYRLNLDCFGFIDGDRMTNAKFDELFGGPARQAETRIRRKDMDMAASIQAVTTEAVLGLARRAREQTGARHAVLAGGVALNCVANGVLQRSGIFDDIWIQPAAGDAGGALGAALLVNHTYFGEPRELPSDGRDSQHGSYLGPAFSNGEINAFLTRHDYPAERINDKEARAQVVAQALSEGKVVGFFSGRMEFGPRSLGARSILGDARGRDTQSKVNLKVKYRESFRPFAPAVLAEDVEQHFELRGESPYMLLVAPVREDKRLPMLPGLFESDDDDDLLRIVNQPRSDLPAITHVDYSARVQTVDARDQPEFHRLLKAFKQITGVGVLVNTSFNVRGEPIVCSPKDAYTCFMRTEMDVLVLEDFVLRKEQQPRFDDNDDWKKEYGND